MDFFVRQLEPAWFAARMRLAEFLATAPENLVFAENATAAMNVVAASVQLQREHEILLTNHEYGAVVRIWQRAAATSGASVQVARLPEVMESSEQVIDALFASVTDRTRLIVVSHITSPTAITLPVERICAEARRREIAVCVDGPHAVAQLPLDLDRLDCDFYCASCHKWLCAPFGSGFLYAAPRRQANLRPPLLSWGRIPPTPLEHWSDEFLWSGTRDPSAYLAIPAAIDYLESVGLATFRERSHRLAQYTRQRILDLVGGQPITPNAAEWYSHMTHLPLPPGDAAELQRALWEHDRIEVPVIQWNDRRWIRVSHHLYNTTADIDHLVQALSRHMPM
jgi:isopenicillin-N epimerase